MDAVRFLFDFILHIDVHLADIVQAAGPWTYAVLGAIVFCETGLVVMPLLPGDSLLFAAGALAAKPEHLLNVHLMAGILLTAAIAGDALNYAIGKRFGRAIAARGWVKASHLQKTEAFFEKHGGKAIVLARFVPIVRTIAPFVAGMGTMQYGQFFRFNVIGAFAWVLMFLYGGFLFGTIPFVEENFSVVVLAVIALSVLPVLIEVIRGMRAPAVPEAVADAQAAVAAQDAARAVENVETEGHRNR